VPKGFLFAKYRFLYEKPVAVFPMVIGKLAAAAVAF